MDSRPGTPLGEEHYNPTKQLGDASLCRPNENNKLMHNENGLLSPPYKENELFSPWFPFTLASSSCKWSLL